MGADCCASKPSYSPARENSNKVQQPAQLERKSDMGRVPMNTTDPYQNELIRHVTKNFDFSDLTQSNDPQLRRIGTQMQKAFHDPIATIKAEFDIEEEGLFNAEDEVILCGPFSKVKLFMTNKAKQQWTDTKICGQASIVLLKDVGAPITVLRILQESDNGEVGEPIFEYELPVNFTFEKLSDRLSAVSFLNEGQFIGIYFTKSVANCMNFNKKVTELCEQLTMDTMKFEAIKQIAADRAKEIQKNLFKLVKSIDTEVLLRGNGSEEHSRELNKLLAAAGVNKQDLEDGVCMDLIQGILTDAITDEQLDEEDIEFAARAIAFNVTSSHGHKKSSVQRGPQRGQALDPSTRMSGSRRTPPPASLQKKVTFGTNAYAGANKQGLGLIYEDRGSIEEDTENLADETDENVSNTAPKNSIFDKDIFTRFSAQSEIKSRIDTKDAQRQKSLRQSQKLKNASRNVKRQARENERIKTELEIREKALQQKNIMVQGPSLSKKLSELAEESNPLAKSQRLSKLEKEISQQQEQFNDEKRLLQDRLRLAESEREQLREQLKQAEHENARLETKLNSDTVQATRNLLKGNVALSSPQPAGGIPPPPPPPMQKGPPPAPPLGARGPPRAPPRAPRGPVRPPPPPPPKPQAAAPGATLIEQLEMQRLKLRKPAMPSQPKPKQLTLVDQLNLQMEKMKKKAEEKRNNPNLEQERKSIAAKQSEAAEIDENDKAWNLTKQLKSRMEALHGRGNKSKFAARKRKFKKSNNLSDDDTTPSEFDQDDSENDPDSNDESD